MKEKDDLLAGRELSNGDGLTVGRLANLFLTSKQRLVDSGELTPRSWNDYRAICARVLRVFGPGRLVANLHPADFEKLRADFAKTHVRAWLFPKPARLGKELPASNSAATYDGAPAHGQLRARWLV